MHKVSIMSVKIQNIQNNLSRYQRSRKQFVLTSRIDQTEGLARRYCCIFITRLFAFIWRKGASCDLVKVLDTINRVIIEEDKISTSLTSLHEILLQCEEFKSKKAKKKLDATIQQIQRKLISLEHSQHTDPSYGKKDQNNNDQKEEVFSAQDVDLEKQKSITIEKETPKIDKEQQDKLFCKNLATLMMFCSAFGTNMPLTEQEDWLNNGQTCSLSDFLSVRDLSQLPKPQIEKLAKKVKDQCNAMKEIARHEREGKAKPPPLLLFARVDVPEREDFCLDSRP